MRTKTVVIASPTRKTGLRRSRFHAEAMRLVPGESETAPASARASMRARLRSPGRGMGRGVPGSGVLGVVLIGSSLGGR